MSNSPPVAAVRIRPTRVGRLYDYLQEMFPPALSIPAGIAAFASVYLGVEALSGVRPLRVTPRSLGGAATVILFMLLLRVYDELKDVETDLRLGRAGDPRYKDRAIVQGRVTPGDLVALRWAVTIALVGLNAPLGAPHPLVAFVVLFVLGWCSFKWFFYPPISKSLLLALVTHNPLVLLMNVYVVAVFVADFGGASLGRATLVLLFGLSLPAAAWETSRKLRLPEDETAYQTYSKVLGLRVAAALPALAVLLSAGCLLVVSRLAQLSAVFSAVLALAALIPIAGAVRLIVKPSRAATNLRPLVEVYTLVATVGLSVAAIVRYGIAW